MFISGPLFSFSIAKFTLSVVEGLWLNLKTCTPLDRVSNAVIYFAAVSERNRFLLHNAGLTLSRKRIQKFTHKHSVLVMDPLGSMELVIFVTRHFIFRLSKLRFVFLFPYNSIKILL